MLFRVLLRMIDERGDLTWFRRSVAMTTGVFIARSNEREQNPVGGTRALGDPNLAESQKLALVHGVLERQGPGWAIGRRASECPPLRMNGKIHPVFGILASRSNVPGGGR